ncbi:MAG: hypothetical protein CMJ80_01565, partial [Planctomycetaceae bacterium]|nr:hypothetical protein [Planctomycetaceae bacterium]
MTCHDAHADPPEIQLSNEILTARMYVPDAERGYYRGARFDWSGVISSLKYAGHEYFGEWQTADDPYLHDRITGPVDSFSANTDISAGQKFLRIGTGVCEKVKAEANWPHPFRVVDAGRWTTQSGANWVVMIQQIETDDGHAYQYRKTITLIPGLPEMVIDHQLTNTGSSVLESSVYNHNFFVIDDQATGPDFVIRFPFTLRAEDSRFNGFAGVDGNHLKFLKEIPADDYIITMLTGFTDSTNDHQFQIEHRKTKAGVRMVTDRPMNKLRFWSPRSTVCPEPFIDIKLHPNQSDRWA